MRVAAPTIVELYTQPNPWGLVTLGPQWVGARTTLRTLWDNFFGAGISGALGR